MELENNGRDPNARRRLDGQAMMDRDEQVARLREQGVPFRAIAKRLGCSLGSVQKALRRVQAKRADAASADVDVVDPDDVEPVGRVRLFGADERGVELFVDEAGVKWTQLGLYRAQRFKALRAAGRDPHTGR